MDTYSIVLFVHVLGVVLLFAAFSATQLGGARLRRAGSVTGEYPGPGGLDLALHNEWLRGWCVVVDDHQARMDRVDSRHSCVRAYRRSLRIAGDAIAGYLPDVKPSRSSLHVVSINDP
jgi:hypothetical protein